jgi:hypothetical protein
MAYMEEDDEVAGLFLATGKYNFRNKFYFISFSILSRVRG